jgi:BirA family transcriptional regulator, biotin operon repressor / biotin---[acetyl-CoA-carboxylase] ligase
MVDDLNEEAIRRALPDRPVRYYPALVTTEADALAWTHDDAPAGALVVAEHQVAARNRAGFVWETRGDAAVGFSLVLRPGLPVHREGWLFAVTGAALVDVAGPDAAIIWPDEVTVDRRRWAGFTVRTESEGHELAAAIVSVVLDAPEANHPQVLARTVRAIEARLAADEEETRVLVAERCATIGRSVTARLVPLGPTGQRVSGLAVDIKRDGALVLRTRDERRMAVRPHAVGLLEEAL